MDRPDARSYRGLDRIETFEEEREWPAGPIVRVREGADRRELIGEAALRIAPLTDADAGELVASGKAGRLVAGFRGAPAADAAALVDLVLRLGLLGEELPAVAELDFNPVLALPDRCVAVGRARAGAEAGAGC